MKDVDKLAHAYRTLALFYTTLNLNRDQRNMFYKSLMTIAEILEANGEKFDDSASWNKSRTDPHSGWDQLA